MKSRMKSIAFIAQATMFVVDPEAKSEKRSHTISILTILISSSGFSLKTFVFSIRCTTSNPCTARPNIVCLLSLHNHQHILQLYIKHFYTYNQGVFSVVIKN